MNPYRMGTITIRTARLASASAATIVAVLLAGCGGGADNAPTAQQISDAEAAVRSVLSAQQQPIWTEAAYTGVAQGGDVCVEVDTGDALGPEEAVRYQHRIVDVPGMEVGPPLEGRC